MVLGASELFFRDRGELQQCEHALGLIQCLKAERGALKMGCLDMR